MSAVSERKYNNQLILIIVVLMLILIDDLSLADAFRSGNVIIISISE